jgi:hypothetical protein
MLLILIGQCITGSIVIIVIIIIIIIEIGENVIVAGVGVVSRCHALIATGIVRSLPSIFRKVGTSSADLNHLSYLGQTKEISRSDFVSVGCFFTLLFC